MADNYNRWPQQHQRLTDAIDEYTTAVDAYLKGGRVSILKTEEKKR